MMQYLWMFLTAFAAFAFGRNIILWTVSAYLFGWIPLVVIALLPNKNEVIERRSSAINEWAEDKAIQKEVGNFETVDDLFKQLETK